MLSKLNSVNIESKSTKYIIVPRSIFKFVIYFIKKYFRTRNILIINKFPIKKFENIPRKPTSKKTLGICLVIGYGSKLFN